MYEDVLYVRLDMHIKTGLQGVFFMEMFDSHFTYQLIYDERTFDNLYSNLDFRLFVREFYSPEVVEFNIRTVRNRWNKSSRIKRRLLSMLQNPSNDPLYFATFTFDEYYITLPYLTLRHYIAGFLRSNFSEYICNVDYGSLNGRLHFHAVVRCRGQPPESPYGFSNYKLLYNSADNLGMCSNYLNKLTNHSTKEKGRVLYSKNLRYEVLYND